MSKNVFDSPGSMLSFKPEAGGLGGIVIERTTDDLFKKSSKSAGSGEDNFLDALRQMQEKARARTAPSLAGGIKLGAAVDFGLASSLGIAESGAAKLLKEARELIDAQQYHRALPTLDEALREYPAEHEAAYLKGVCFNALNRFEEALRAIAPLRNNPTVKNRLATRVRALREDVRGKLMDPVFTEFMVLLQAGQLERATARFRDLAALDPEFWYCQYLLSGILMMLGRLEESFAAAQAGFDVCVGPERETLAGLRNNLVVKLAKQKLGPACTLYKTGKYGQARALLRGLDARVQAASLCVTFASYLDELEAKRRGPADVEPPGLPDAVEELYWFLLENELSEVKTLIHQEKHERAEQVLRASHGYAPRFPFINFLYGTCLYRRLGRQFDAATPPSLDEAIATLESANSLLRAAVADPEITGAPRQLEMVEETLQQLRETRVELHARMEAAKPINEAMAEFRSIMESAKGGINSIEQLDREYRRMAALRDRVAGLERTVASDDGKEAVRMLKEAVARSLSQLDGIRPGMKESVVVKGLYQRFESTMENLESKGGVSSPREAQELKSFMQTLKNDAEAARRTLVDADSRKAVDQLTDVLKTVLSQLK